MDDGRVPETPAEIDPLLAPLLALPSDRTEATIEALVNRAVAEVVDPILRGVARSAPPDVTAELRAEVVVRLLGRLRAITIDPSLAIASFPDYAAVVTYHAFDDWMRQRYPQRARLKNRVRYVIEHDDRFTVTRARSGSVVTLAGPAPAPGSTPAEKLLHAIGDLLADHGRVMELDALVTRVAERFGIRDEADAPLSAIGEPSTSDPMQARLENRDDLKRLWVEIAALPPRQRLALLLHLRDEEGDAMVLLLPAIGIASMTEIARVLELDERELAAIWNGLPMPDLEIAARLGLTRQQVINLRKSARERLARRMKQPW